VKEDHFNFRSRLPERPEKRTLIKLVFYTVVSTMLIFYLYSTI